ncbi:MULTISPECIES: alpha/beta fold hydrolase [Halorussus]|uniref:alpha/beta fold hydrolase n=1 Tax=Halorussus TaxID=1070314 RepID=UPI000E20CD2B|nr:MULTISPECIES: alpha/beta hydrolase [Halorussus]NHN60336.1 alpha/beta hydrolase [Halorussus sp. JP-T4]
MPLDHAAEPSETARPYLDALEAVCDHYGADAESRYADLAAPADRVHYLTAGDGPPLLLLHGLGTTSTSWVPMFDALTDRFTVYAPDRPGRGLSTAVDYRETGFREFGVEYVVDLLDALDVEETAVMGNSLGGFQSLALTVDRPERVTRLCAIGAPAGLSRSIPTFLRLFDLPAVGDWLFDYFKAETVADARRAYRQMNVTDDAALPDVYFRPGIVGEDLPGQRESLRSLMETLGTLRGMRPQFDIRDDVRRVEAPTRFVWGTEDYFWPPSVGRPVAGAMANADFVTLHDHGHMPWLEPDDDATEPAVRFLAGEIGADGDA